MPRRRLSRIQWTYIAGGALVLFVAAQIPVVIAMRGPSRATVIDLMSMVPPYAVALFCLLAARAASSTKVRWFWILLAAGQALSGFGDIAWAYYEQVLKIAAPYPFIGDVGYVAYYPVMLAGFLALMSFRGRGKLAAASGMLDALLFGVSAGALSWLLLLVPFHNPSTGALARLADMAYSGADVLLLVAIVSMVFLSGASLRPRGLVWLGASLGTWLVADTAYAFVSANGSFATGGWISAAWPLAYAFAGIGALVYVKTAAKAAARGTGTVALEQSSPRVRKAAERMRLAIPYLACPAIAVLLCVRFLVQEGRGIAGDVVTIGLALVLTSMVLVRQLLTVVENRRLQASMAELSRDLEVRVMSRTEELATEKEHLAMLNRVAEEMSQCLTAKEVIRGGLRLARKTAGCDQSGLWLTSPGRPGRFFGGAGLSRVGRRQFIDVLVKSAVAASVRDHGTTACVDGAALRACLSEEAREPMFRRILLLPLISRRSVLGVLCLGYGQESADTSGERIALARGVASQIAVALENARRYDEARRLAEQDPVTDLLNSRGLARALERELARSQRVGTWFSVLMMDMDNFKLLNDTHGHAVGDQVLRQTAGVLQKALRRSDVVARQGGDEFMAILPDTSTARAVECFNHIREALSSGGFRVDTESHIPLTLSCGIATYPVDGRRAGELLAVADANVYRSKHRGGDCVTPAAVRDQGGETRGGVFTVLEGLVVAVDNKDHYTRRHSDDVTQYAIELADRLGLSSETVRPLRIAGVLHDVGKIGIPDYILRKPGPLDRSEFEAIKQHVSLGELMIKEIPDLHDVLAAVGAHHERWDGGGYPRGLAGDEIPLLGRILAVSDAYSAMTTDRPYRKARTLPEAREEMCRVAGTQLDARLVGVFLDILADWESGGGGNGRRNASGSLSSSAA